MTYPETDAQGRVGLSGSHSDVGAVVIGRNEGKRLVRALTALEGQITRVIYVDSGSTDGSVAAATAAGAEVIGLDLSYPFTAARARNAGFEALEQDDMPAFVQFIDGDCEIQPGWIDAARTFLQAHPGIAVVFGRLRERYPDATVYNQLCDREWDVPVGACKSSGGIFLARSTAMRQVEGFNSTLIAGEEPELCVRLRAAGWEIWCIDAEMALHDAAMTRLGQWWARTRRAGHAAAEGMAMHGGKPERHRVREVRRSLAWGLVLPLTILMGLVATPWALLGVLAYPLQILRLALRDGGGKPAWAHAFFLTLAKLPETQGILGYWAGRVSGKRQGLIEYK